MLADALGRPLEIAAMPQRIVSLVPSITEWLFSIGAGDRVVAITDYCIAPAAELSGLPRIGGTKNPNRARIIDVRPDLVIADQEENRERDVQALSAAGVAVYVTAIRRVADLAAQLAPLAEILGCATNAAPLFADLRIALAVISQNPERRPIPTLAFIWRDPWMVIGDDTYAGDLLRLCGAANLGQQLPGRYPRADLDTFMALGPEVILLPDEPYRFSSADRAAFAAYVNVPAVQHNRIILCDGMSLTWPGPRTLTALQHLREIM